MCPGISSTRACSRSSKGRKKCSRCASSAERSNPRDHVQPEPDSLPPPWSSANDLEALARERLGVAVYDYVAGGAGEELTLAANREGFERLRLRPRVLVDVTSVSAATTLLGMNLSAPLFVAPMGTPSH